MSSSALQEYARGFLGHIPWEHLVVMVVVASAWTVILLIRKKYSVYGAVAWGLTVFMVLFLLDTAVVIRYLGFVISYCFPYLYEVGLDSLFELIV